jgi:hypothetical protein
VRSNTYPIHLEYDRILTSIAGLDDWLMTIALVFALIDTAIASRLRADLFLRIASQHRMPYLHCLPNTPWPRKARRHTSVSSSMGASFVRVAILLLHFRHSRIQLHKAFHRSILVALSTPDEVYLDLARHSGCDFTCVPLRTRAFALTPSPAFLVLFTIGSVLAIILQCKPVAAGYDLTLRPPTGTGTCYGIDIFKKVGVFNSCEAIFTNHIMMFRSLTSTAINIATDLLFAILPIPLVWGLQLNMRTKLGLVCILSLGFFAAATAIYKTPMQYHFFEERDFTGKGAWYCMAPHNLITIPSATPLTASNRRLANRRNERRHPSRLPPNHQTALHILLRCRSRHHVGPYCTHARPFGIPRTSWAFRSLLGQP